MTLGKLARVKLREYWKHEARDFTRWLAEPENIELLADEVGIDIKIIQTIFRGQYTYFRKLTRLFLTSKRGKRRGHT